MTSIMDISMFFDDRGRIRSGNLWRVTVQVDRKCMSVLLCSVERNVRVHVALREWEMAPKVGQKVGCS
jgi:hypothetical protein